MNFMRDFFSGVVDGLVNGAANQMRSAPGGGRASDRGRIERLCRELGWSVDERDGNAILLHFRAPDGEMRKVRISGGDNSMVGFITHSHAVLSADRVPPDLLGYLLRRNLEDSGMGTWSITVDDDDNDVTFHLFYTALGAGLDAQTFEYICESLSSEASHLDDKLRRAGLLD
jgi:hypothetical protein